jgi:hypothetical protein
MAPGYLGSSMEDANDPELEAKPKAPHQSNSIYEPSRYSLRWILSSTSNRCAWLLRIMVFAHSCSTPW